MLSIKLLHDAGLRPFRPEDAEAVNAVENADRSRPWTVTEWWANDPHRTGREVFVRWVVGDPVVAYLNVTDRATTALAIPGTCHLNLHVAPGHRRRGLGSALHELAVSFAREWGSRTLRAWYPESDTTTGFAARHGYEEVERREALRLDLAAFDPGRFAERVAAVEASGVRLVAYADLGDTATNRRRLHALHRAIHNDLADFPVWEAATFRGVDWSTERWWVAEADGVLVAVVGAGIGRSGVAAQRLTATLPAYRGRRIATALKVRLLADLKATGARAVWTNPRTDNAPMLAVNRRLGFARTGEPAQLVYHRPVRPV